MLWLLLLCSLFSCALCVDNGLGLLPPLGWNTWCTQGECGRDYCDETMIKSIADTMVSNGMSSLGYQYVNLDDCWALERDSSGYILPDPQRFPNGMKSVIDYVHSKGLKFGLYTDAGQFTCATGGRPHPIPGSYGHYEQDAKTYAAWGVDYVKMDWCNTRINGTQLKPEIQYAQMSKALNATGRRIYFLSCEWGVDEPWKWMRQFANAWRSTGDHRDNWKSTASVIDQVAEIQDYAGPGGWNYMDFIMTGGQGCPPYTPGLRCPGQTDDEYRTEFTMWVIAASPLIVATDIRNMSAIQKEILFNKDMLAVHQDKLGRGGGRIGTWACSEANACEIWAKPLFDGSYAVALYNKGSLPHGITLNFSLLGWQNLPVSVYDLWAHKNLGSFQTSYTATVPSHGVNAVKVKFQSA